MSRNVIFKDEKLTVVQGIDHMLGEFYQLYDNELLNETKEGEGIILDWSEQFSYETNLTGIPNKDNVLDVINEYVSENGNPID